MSAALAVIDARIAATARRVSVLADRMADAEDLDTVMEITPELEQETAAAALLAEVRAEVAAAEAAEFVA